MIKGMTGYGTVSFSVGGVRGTVEIKSLNHRYFDIAYFLPIGFASVENKIKQIVLKNVHRGRVTISIKLNQRPCPRIVVNKQVVRQYVQHANKLKRELGLDNDLALSDFIKLPGVVEAEETIINGETLWPAVEKNLIRSLQSLENMRIREGRSLSMDIAKQLKSMSEQIRTISIRAKEVLKEKKKQLTEEEFLSYQKSTDINEEISRLQHYIDEFTKLVKSTGPIGKKLDFVAQEMQRETNTMGSKLQDKIVSNAVITLKSKIEKIREQVQNIE